MKLVSVADVFCLRPLFAVGDDKGNPLSVAQSAASLSTDGTEMYENFLAVIHGDKAKALGRIEPFDLAVFTVRVCAVFALCARPVCFVLLIFLWRSG